jgi:uroporphyrinogen-III decarboxylase
MVLGTDLILNEQADPDSVLLDGKRLGQVIAQTAKRYGTPLAVPHMDLRREKEDLLHVLRITDCDPDTFHFQEPPSVEKLRHMESEFNIPLAPRSLVHTASVEYIARQHPNLIPIGMAIGPFSLMTKLMADPITPIAGAGAGLTAADDPNILMAERCLELAQTEVLRAVQAQLQAGARAMLICEPAANIAYLSPRQIKRGADIFERFVMRPNLLVKRLLASFGAELFFHDCGELSSDMVRKFAEQLDPAILSLGSSRRLWEDAALVPKHTVLYGNLPTKLFYSDAAMPVDRVETLTRELVERMRNTGHPHILGSECDVLHVPETADTIRRKVEAMLTCGR